MHVAPSLLPHQTSRLILRPFTAAELPTFVAYRADPEIARYQSWSDYTAEMGEAFLAGQDAATFGAPGQWCQVALILRETGACVGDVVIQVKEHDPRQAEVGFTLARTHQGAGYASEGLRALLKIAFEGLKLHRVVAITDALNTPSVSLLDRVGFRREGHFIENIFFKGAWGDEFHFGLLAREWAANVTAGR